MDGGVLMNQGIHGIDYLLTIMNSPVVSVFGKSQTAFIHLMKRKIFAPGSLPLKMEH